MGVYAIRSENKMSPSPDGSAKGRSAEGLALKG